ncbi:MAG TPA: protein kinase [Rhodanobacteraceae bacterium]|nr:protein kinase [Rhodanobacteraceae bacterium]
MNHTLLTPLPSPEKVDSLAQRGLDVSMIAHLAFARAGDASVAEGRHLALLPIESLELDLADPAQCQFGDYELLELIGEGGMGVVYRARQLSLDREVAIKLLAAGVWASTEFVERFRREAQNAARMQHPNIVPVYEVGDHDGLHFFSMRLIAGPSLAAELKREERLSPQHAARLLRTIAEAVDYAHRLGVLHLDLKPANVLIDENGTPHVADFGLARRIDSALAADSDEVSGTPSYMAPEQASPRTSRITRATDIWGLGAILYELVTGEPPFLAHSAQETLKLVVQGSLRSPRRYVADLPRDLEAIILKCMAYRVDERYASARDLADDLSRFLDGRAVVARPLNAAQRAMRWARREPKLAAMTLCAFAALLIGLAATTKQWQRADDNAQHAQANALVARERLWDSRDAASLRLFDDGDGWNAAPLLVANVEEMEAAGAGGRAAAARRRLGIVENTNPRLTDMFTFAGSAQTSAISPDGSRLAVCAEPLEVQMVEIASGKQLWAREYPPETSVYSAVTSATFSPDGKALLLESRTVPMAPFPHGFDAMIDAATGELRMPPPEFAEIGSATFSADGRVAILTDNPGRSQLWSTEPWRPLGPLRPLAANPGLPFVFALIAPDDRRFVYTHHGRVALVDGTTMSERSVPLSNDFGAIAAWAVSPEWTWLVVGDREGHLAAIDMRDMSIHGLAPMPFHAVHSFRFSSDGTLLAAAAGASGVYVWRWPLGELVAAPFGAPQAIDNIEIDAGQNRVLALAGDGSASLWQLMPAALTLDRNTALRLGDRFGQATPAPNDFQQWHNGTVTWLPDEDLVAVSEGATRVARLPPPVYKRAHGAPIRTTPLHFDGRRLATVEGNRVQVVDALREAPLAAPIELPQPPSFAEIAEGDALVVVEGRRLHSFTIGDGAARFAPIELTNSPLHVDLSPDGRRAVTGWLDHGEYGTGEVLELWDLAAGTRIGEPLRVPGPLDGLAFSASGRRLVAYGVQNLTLRSGETLGVVSDALADLRAPGFRKSLDLSTFAHVAFDGDDLLLIEVRGERSESKGSELRRYASDGRVSSQTVPADWKSILPVPASRNLLVVANDDAPALRGADGSMRQLRDAAGVDGGAALAASPDGRWLARGLRDGVDLFDADDGRRLARLRAPLPLPDRVWQLAFSPDGNRLLARSVRNRWLVWDIAPEARAPAAVRRELELGGVDVGYAVAPAREDERAALRAHDPGAPSMPPRAALPGVRTVAGGGIAARSAQASPVTLDLTPVYNLGLNEVSRPTLHSPADFAWLPQGVQRLLGIDYDIRGALQLRDEEGFYEQPMTTAPRAVHVPVAKQRAAAIDALMMSALTCPANPHRPFAMVGLEYADGSVADLPVRCDFDLFHWRQISALGDHAQVAVRGLDARLVALLWRPVHVYAVHLANPHPEKMVQGVKLVAGLGSGGGPMFLAVTLEPAQEVAADAH